MKGLFGKLVTAFVVLSFLTGPAFAQAPEIEWFVGIGHPDGAMSHEGMQTSDGGYICIGQTLARNPDMFVSKVDSSGTEEWSVAVGVIRKKDFGVCVAEASDGYICGGGIYDSTARGHVRGLVKLNKTNGNVIWQKTYGTADSGAIRGVQVLGDGSIITTGYDGSGESGYLYICDDGTGFTMKTDSSGNMIWENTLPVPQGTKIHEISGGFAVISCAWYYDEGDHMDGVIIETDTSGNVTSNNHYGSTSDEHCYDGKPTSDGGYILGGHTLGYGVLNWDFWLCKVDSSGTEEWVSTFGQPRGYDPAWIFDEAYAVQQTPDGGYVIAGGSGDESAYSDCSSACGCSDNYVAEVVKTDSSGNLEWQAPYPCGSWGCDSAAEYIDVTSDGGYIAFLDTCAFGEDSFGFLKLGEPAEPCTDPTYVAVDSIVCSTVGVGKGFKIGRATVTILDECGDPAVGYTVTGTFTGDLNETQSGDTDSSGVAVIDTVGSKKGKVNFQFCVDSVTGGSLPYDDTQNVETCDTN
ncbi:MAG: hypothetical protein ACYS8Y_07800 [Planctomycetota bacterium]|jgi:hypothetical protein